MTLQKNKVTKPPKIRRTSKDSHKKIFKTSLRDNLELSRAAREYKENQELPKKENNKKILCLN